MKQIINEKDIKNLRGKFAVQLNNHHDEPDMTANFKENSGFWLEKRIFFINILYGVDGLPHYKPKEQLIVCSGFYYMQGMYTNSEFVEYWNNGYKSKKERYHRLLTNKELDWLLEARLKN